MTFHNAADEREFNEVLDAEADERAREEAMCAEHDAMSDTAHNPADFDYQRYI